MFTNFINALSDLLYSHILIILLLGTGIYFSIRTRFVQFRLFAESIRVVAQPNTEGTGLSSFQALMVSTASRVGTGNIAGISTAICLGGPGAVFWMWLTALLGSASAFIESTLAQIYKRKAEDGSSYGGPAYYIQAALKKHWIGVLFAVFLILTYMGGFNLVASFNIADSFRAYDFFSESSTPLIVGIILAAVFAVSIFGGSKQISKMLQCIGDFERISDHAVNVMEAARELHDKKLDLSKEGRHELKTATAAIREILDLAVKSFDEDDLETAYHVEPLEEVMDNLVEEIRRNHINRLQAGECTIQQGFVLSDILTNYERVSDHCSNIGVAVIELANKDSFDAHEYLDRLKTMEDPAFKEAFKSYRKKYAI